MSIFNTGVNPLRKMGRVVPIFITITNDYAPYAAAAIHSLTHYTNPNRYYRVIILYDKMTFKNRVRLRALATRNCAIQFHKMKYNVYMRAIVKYCASWTGSGDFFSSAVYYYRHFIARLFLQYEKAIYIDSDVILRTDIGELFDIDLGDNVIAAMVDPKVEVVPEFREYVENALGVPHKEYVNSGVLLMDLKKLRKCKFIATMIDIINEYNADLVAPDQDYLNVILKGKIMHLPAEWNQQPMKDLPKDTKLLHYNLTEKPWYYDDVPQGELFWDNMKGTVFYGDLMRAKENFTIQDARMDKLKIESLVKKAGELAKAKKPVMKLVKKK